MAGAQVPLRYVNFQGVQQLGIFISGNQGDAEVTQLSKLAILGELVAQTGLKRSADQQASASKGDWIRANVLSISASGELQSCSCKAVTPQRDSRFENIQHGTPG